MKKYLAIFMIIFISSISFSAQRFGENRNIKNITVNYTVKAYEDTIFANAINNKITVTLPKASQFKGKAVKVVKIDTSSNAVTIKVPSGDAFIPAAGPAAIITEGGYADLISNGVTSYIV